MALFDFVACQKKLFFHHITIVNIYLKIVSFA